MEFLGSFGSGEQSLAKKNLGLDSSREGLLLIDEDLPFETLPSLNCSCPSNCSFDSDLPAVGLDGRLALTSFAYTNMGELSGLVVLVAESFRSKRDGLDDMEDPNPSLITLDALDLRPDVEILRPSPLAARASSVGFHFSREEAVLESLTVPFGAPLGVDDALSTLAFLEPDRGVTLELRKALTGVATSSGSSPFSTFSPSTQSCLRRTEDPLVAGGAIVLATPFPCPAHLGDCVVVFAIGRRLGMPFCFSELIVAVPCRVRVAE